MIWHDNCIPSTPITWLQTKHWRFYSTFYLCESYSYLIVYKCDCKSWIYPQDNKSISGSNYQHPSVYQFYDIYILFSVQARLTEEAKCCWWMVYFHKFLLSNSTTQTLWMKTDSTSSVSSAGDAQPKNSHDRRWHLGYLEPGSSAPAGRSEVTTCHSPHEPKLTFKSDKTTHIPHSSTDRESRFLCGFRDRNYCRKFSVSALVFLLLCLTCTALLELHLSTQLSVTVLCLSMCGKWPWE